jgi:hypothetical protein
MKEWLAKEWMSEWVIVRELFVRLKYRVVNE